VRSGLFGKNRRPPAAYCIRGADKGGSSPLYAAMKRFYKFVLPASPHRGYPWLYFLLIIVCSGIVYVRTLNYDFVNYDDYDLVYQNAGYLSDISNVFTSFTTHAFTTHRKVSFYYRPILLISYVADYQLWELNPLGYHLTNILLHSLSAILILLLLLSILHDPLAALLASLLFCLHPVQVESVAWISGRNDILLGLFIVLMVYFYVLHHEKREKGGMFLSLSALCYGLALFTKESAAFYVLLLPLYDLTVRKTPLKALFDRASLKKFSAILAPLVIYLVVRLWIFGEFIGTEKLYTMLPLKTRLELFPAMITQYITLLLYPVNLSIEHPLDKLIWVQDPWYLIACVIFLFLLAAVYLTWRIDGATCFGFVWLVAGLLPALNIIPVAVPIFEHRLYAPSAGFAMLVVCVLFRVLNLKIIRMTLPAALVIVVLAGIGSYNRVSAWRNSEALWMDAIAKEPAAARPYYNLASYYYDHKWYQKTIELVNTYIGLNQGDSLGYKLLRQTYFITGNYGKASAVCRQMISMDPGNQIRYLDLGLLYEELGLGDSARSVYAEGLGVDPKFYMLHTRLGRIYQNLNDTLNAIKHCREAVNYKPDYAPAYFQMGAIYAACGDTTEAAKWVLKGMRYGAPSEEMIRELGFVMNSGKFNGSGRSDR